MQLLVRNLRGTTTAVGDVSPAETVEALKLRIEAQEGVPAGDQVLVYAGKRLDGTRSLGGWGLEHAATVTLTSRLLGGKPVKVKMMTDHLACGSEVTIDIEASASKDEIRGKLEAATGVPAAQQKVMLSSIGQIVMGDKRTNLGYSSCGSTNGVQMAVTAKK